MRRAVVAVVLVAALAASACGDDDSSANVTAATTSVAPGTLTDAPCNAAAGFPPTKCFFFEVPERRDGGSTKTIKLFVAVVTPSDSAPDETPVVWLTGGPGLPASAILDSRLSFVGTPRPVVYVDQRGTGRSVPRLDCTALEGGPPDGAKPWAQRVAVVEAAAKVCRDRLVASGVDLDGFNTAEDAADIVALREALGYDRWLIYGVSYGGRLAQQVMKLDEGAIKGVILDSSITSSRLGPASLIERAKDALVRLSNACGAEPTCHELTTDLESTVAEAVARMDAKPFTTGVTKPDGSPFVVSGQEVLSGIFTAQYESGLVPGLPGTVKSIADGDTGILDPLASRLTAYDGTAMGLLAASLCADDGADLSPEDQAALRDPGEYGSEILRWPYPVCGVWNVARVPGGPLTEPVSDVPVLLIEGGLDPIAPPRFADIIKAGLSHATVVVIPAGGHGNAFSSDCAASISVAFLDNPQAPVDASCVASVSRPLAP